MCYGIPEFTVFEATVEYGVSRSARSSFPWYFVIVSSGPQVVGRSR